MSLLNFDASKVEPQKALEPVPAGWYPVVMDKSELKPTKADGGKGTRLNFEATIIDGEHKGRKIFGGLNIKNSNPVAQEIAAQQLSAICHATGVMRVKDSTELHGKPFQVRVIVVPAQDGYDAKNEIKAFKAVDGAAGGGAATPAAGAPPWAAGGTKPPGKPAAPAAVAAAPGKPKPPGKPKDTRKFFVYVNDDSKPVTADDLQAMVNAGETENPVCLEGTEDWKLAADFGIVATAAAGAPAGAKPPWAK